MSVEDSDDKFPVGLPLVYKDASGEWQFGRIENRVGARLLLRKGGVVKVIAKPEVVWRRVAASFSLALDSEFAFDGNFNNSITLWEGGKEYRGKVLEVPRSGECVVEFRDESGSRRTVERFQDEVVLHRRRGVNSARRRGAQSAEEETQD